MFTFKDNARAYVCLSVFALICFSSVLYLKLLYIRLMHVISLCPSPPPSLRWPEWVFSPFSSFAWLRLPMATKVSLLHPFEWWYWALCWWLSATECVNISVCSSAAYSSFKPDTQSVLLYVTGVKYEIVSVNKCVPPLWMTTVDFVEIAKGRPHLKVAWEETTWWRKWWNNKKPNRWWWDRNIWRRTGSLWEREGEWEVDSCPWRKGWKLIYSRFC